MSVILRLTVFKSGFTTGLKIICGTVYSRSILLSISPSFSLLRISMRGARSLPKTELLHHAAVKHNLLFVLQRFFIDKLHIFMGKRQALTKVFMGHVKR